MKQPSSVVKVRNRKTRIRAQSRDRARGSLRSIVVWYFREVYGRYEGPGVLPFYCDPERVGHFAVTPQELAAGSERALFRLFVTLAMYQARRDVVIMKQQRGLSIGAATTLTALGALARRARANPCPVLRTPESFDEGCDVTKRAAVVDCGRRPGASCHVKDATAFFNRMGDFGKLPTSAWLRVWREGGLRNLLQDVTRSESIPEMRAKILVARFSRVRRVGRKLATMFVSALSVPPLAPGLTPWFPEIDGNELLVIDTNVARGIDALEQSGAARTYAARVQWLREAARHLDLRMIRGDLPRYSPRLVQQALYAFCSKSNRVARQDECLGRADACGTCVPALCPLVPRSSRSGSTATMPRGRSVRLGDIVLANS